MILWSVAKCARPQKTRGASESLFCLLTQVFGDTAATGRGVWAQMTLLSLPAVLRGPSWTPELSFWPRTSPHSGKASGVRSLPDCVGPGLSLESLPLLCKSQQPILPAVPALGAETLALSSRFALSLVSTLHFSRRPELLLINPQATDPQPEDALHESSSVGLRSSCWLECSATPKLALLALAGLLATLSLHCKPPDLVGMGGGVPFSQVTWKAGLLEAPVVTFLLRPLAQGVQDSPPNPSPGSDLGP